MNQLQIEIIKTQLNISAEHEAHLEKIISNLKAERDDNNREIISLKEQLRVVGMERDAFKYESDNQAEAWREISTFIPDVNGISLVSMVRRHVDDLNGRIRLLTEEIEQLKNANRYQKGYGDGYEAAKKTILSRLTNVLEIG